MAEQNREILKVEHLKKYFPVPNGMLHAVDDISFTIEQGKTLGVVGESGCGKSTMGRAILRLHEPTSGKVYFDQKDILSFNDKQMKDMRRDMQIIFQDPFASLNPRMTVSEAIAAPLLVQKIYDRKDKAGIQQDLKHVFELFPRLEERKNQSAGTLSGGEQQMLAMGRALMSRPKLLLLDEPSMGLAPLLIKEIFNIIVDINKSGTTVLLVEQNANMALSIANRAYVLETGRITLSGSAQELAASEDVRKAYLGG